MTWNNDKNECLQKYQTEVKILRLFLKAFSHGLEVQKGPTGDIDTGSLLKISTASNEMMEKLDKVPINNLTEERIIGLLNYGIQIRGKDNITTVFEM